MSFYTYNQHQSQTQNIISTLEAIDHSQSISLSCQSNYYYNFYNHRLALPVLDLHINGITQYVVFEDWLLLTQHHDFNSTLSDLSLLLRVVMVSCFSLYMSFSGDSISLEWNCWIIGQTYARSQGKPMFSLNRQSPSFPKWFYHLHSCQKCMNILEAPRSPQYFVFSSFYILAILVDMQKYFIVILICIFLMTNSIECFFYVLLANWIFSLVKCLSYQSSFC